MSRTVSILILRNKKRLIKEISESKDLMVLLGQSSLAIFILPGGSLLLPLLIKFIPQLLPSAFNENK